MISAKPHALILHLLSPFTFQWASRPRSDIFYKKRPLVLSVVFNIKIIDRKINKLLKLKLTFKIKKLVYSIFFCLFYFDIF